MDARRLIVFALETPLAYRGGVSVLVRTLLHGLHQNYRLALVSPDTPESLAESGVSPLLEAHLCWTGGRASRAAARELAEGIAAWSPSLVHFHAGGLYAWGNRRPGTSPLPLLRANGIVCVNTVHLVVSLSHHGVPTNWPRWLRAPLLPVLWLGRMCALAATTKEIAVSEHDLRLLRRWYFPMRGTFERIYHSRLEESGETVPEQAERKPTILHVGHRATRKGQHRLVEAFAQVAPRFPEWRLRLVGPPGDEVFEAQLAKLAGAHAVEVTGASDVETVAALMRESAVYAQPSLEEALGLALQEGLFGGCACVGTRVGGIPELIEDGRNGLLCEADDAGALAGRLERLMGDAELRARLAVAGRASILTRRMTAAGMISRHEELYRSLIP